MSDPDPGRVGAAAGALRRGALLPLLVTGGLATVLGVLDSGAAVVGAVVGSLIPAVAISLPLTIMRISQAWSPPAAMSIALVGYMALVAILGVGLARVDEVSWLAPGWLVWSAFACTLAGVAGLAVAFRRVRMPVYDPPGGVRETVAEGSEGDPR